MRRKFSFVGTVVTVATCFALSGVGAQNADDVGAPAKPVKPFPERNPDPRGGYGDAKPIPSVEEPEPVKPPRNFDAVAATRKEFGLDSPRELMDQALNDFDKRVASGDQKSFLPFTDEEQPMFQRWISLVDSPSFDDFLFAHQDWFAEKVPAFDIHRASITVYVKRGAPKDLIDEFRSKLPAGLAVDLVESAWSGKELESVKVRLANEILALGQEPQADPAMDKARLASLSASSFVARAEQAGVRFVDTKRNSAQAVTLVVPPGTDLAEAKTIVTEVATKNALPAEMFIVEIGTAPTPLRATRESDPGQIKAGVQLIVRNSNESEFFCTSNIALNYGGKTYLVTAGHCVGVAQSPANVGVPAPNFHDDNKTGVWHNGLYLGNFRLFSYNWSSGHDIALVELMQKGDPAVYPQESAPGLASGLYTLTPGYHQTLHYGLSATPHFPTSGSTVCFEGASPDRINAIATNGYNGENGNRCGTVHTSTYAGMQYITGPNTTACGGDSGGLIHTNEGPAGVLAFSDNENCGPNTGYSLFVNELSAFPGATIVSWPSNQKVQLRPGSAPDSCLHAHPNGNTGQPTGGWTQQIPSPYYPWLSCGSTTSDQWRFLANNSYTTGDVYLLDNSAGQCLQPPDPYPDNWDIVVQTWCDSLGNWQIVNAGVGGGYFLMKSMLRPWMCLSVRDPYNPNDPHWFHTWDCFSSHPAQRFVPRG